MYKITLLVIHDVLQLHLVVKRNVSKANLCRATETCHSQKYRQRKRVRTIGKKRNATFVISRGFLHNRRNTSFP